MDGVPNALGYLDAVLCFGRAEKVASYFLESLFGGGFFGGHFFVNDFFQSATDAHHGLGGFFVAVDGDFRAREQGVQYALGGVCFGSAQVVVLAQSG